MIEVSDPFSFALGVISGVALTAIAVSFTAVLFAFRGADSVTRGLDGRKHGKPAVLALYGDSVGLGDTTAPAVDPPTARRSRRRSRSTSPRVHGRHPG